MNFCGDCYKVQLEEGNPAPHTKGNFTYSLARHNTSQTNGLCYAPSKFSLRNFQNQHQSSKFLMPKRSLRKTDLNQIQHNQTPKNYIPVKETMSYNHIKVKNPVIKIQRIPQIDSKPHQQIIQPFFRSQLPSKPYPVQINTNYKMPQQFYFPRTTTRKIQINNSVKVNFNYIKQEVANSSINESIKIVDKTVNSQKKYLKTQATEVTHNLEQIQQEPISQKNQPLSSRRQSKCHQKSQSSSNFQKQPYASDCLHPNSVMLSSPHKSPMMYRSVTHLDQVQCACVQSQLDSNQSSDRISELIDDDFQMLPYTAFKKLESYTPTTLNDSRKQFIFQSLMETKSNFINNPQQELEEQIRFDVERQFIKQLHQ